MKLSDVYTRKSIDKVLNKVKYQHNNVLESPIAHEERAVWHFLRNGLLQLRGSLDKELKAEDNKENKDSKTK